MRGSGNLRGIGLYPYLRPGAGTDYGSPLLESALRESLFRINRGLPTEAVTEALAKLKDFDSGSLLQKNMTFMEYLQNGVPCGIL